MYQAIEELPEYAQRLEAGPERSSRGINTAVGLVGVSFVGDVLIYLNNYDYRLAYGPIIGSIIAASLILRSQAT